MERDDAIRAAAQAFATGRDLMGTMPPREAAEAAHYAGGPSIDDLEQRIRARRAQLAQARAA